MRSEVVGAVSQPVAFALAMATAGGAGGYRVLHTGAGVARREAPPHVEQRRVAVRERGLLAKSLELRARRAGEEGGPSLGELRRQRDGCFPVAALYHKVAEHCS